MISRLVPPDAEFTSVGLHDGSQATGGPQATRRADSSSRLEAPGHHLSTWLASPSGRAGWMTRPSILATAPAATTIDTIAHYNPPHDSPRPWLVGRRAADSVRSTVGAMPDRHALSSRTVFVPWRSAPWSDSPLSPSLEITEPQTVDGRPTLFAAESYG